MAKTINAIFTGDIMAGGNLFAAGREAGWSTFVSRYRPCFEQGDIVFGNLEAPLPSRGVPQKNKIVLQQTEETLLQLKKAGFNGFSLANNHIMDYGVEGLSVTLEKLRSLDLQYTGAGNDLSDARAPAKFMANGLTVHILGYVSATTELSNELIYAGAQKKGLAPFDLPSVQEDIKKSYSDGVDAVIVSLHWGEELCHFPAPQQIDLGRAVIDMGAVMVLGHHSHVLQGVERYKDGVIAYSLGNFLFGEFLMPDGRMERWQERHRLSAFLTCRLERKKVVSFELVPLRIGEDLIPEILSGREQEEALSLIQSYSCEFDRPDYARVWKGEVWKEKIKTVLEKIKRKIVRYEV